MSADPVQVAADAVSVTLHDCVSQAAVKAVSNASSRGSKSSILSEARVQRAVLVVQSGLLDKQIELDLKETRIKAKKDKQKPELK